MPRGMKWTKAETIAVVEAFVHISEDAAVGVNQTSDTLFARVTSEAKKRFAGDWSRLATASKSRWALVSKHVSKFIAAHLIVNSVEHSGWSEDDYYNATVKAYNRMIKKSAPTAAPTATEGATATDDPAMEDPSLSVPFPFKEEWEIMKDHQKWQSSLSRQEKKGKRKSSSNTTEVSSISSDDDDTTPSTERGVGVKKAKAARVLEDHASSLVAEIRLGKQENERNRENMFSAMMEQMQEASEKSMNKLESVLGDNTASLTKTLNMKLLMETDLSKMGQAFQDKARTTIEKHFANLMGD